jgi:hypothetical protein
MNAYCDGSVSPNPCMVTFEIRGIDGSMLQQVTKTIQPNSSDFADFSLAGIAAFRGRGSIAPCWDVAAGSVRISMEIFNSATQQSRLLINWGDRSTPLLGDIDFAPAGLSRGDTARLGAFCPEDSANACNVIFEFHDSQGNVVKTSSATLAPGASGFLELNFDEMPITGRRSIIVPCFKVGETPAVATMAIFGTGGAGGVQAYPATLVSGDR